MPQVDDDDEFEVISTNPERDEFAWDEDEFEEAKKDPSKVPETTEVPDPTKTTVDPPVVEQKKDEPEAAKTPAKTDTTPDDPAKAEIKTFLKTLVEHNAAIGDWEEGEVVKIADKLDFTKDVPDIINDMVREIAIQREEKHYLPEAREFNKFLREGGRAEDFYKRSLDEKSGVQWEAIESTEGDQKIDLYKQVLMAYYINEKNFNERKASQMIKASEFGDPEELELDYKEAKEYYIEKDKQIEAKLVAEQVAQQEARLAEWNKVLEEKKKVISSKRDFGGFETTDKEKEAFYKFVYEFDKTGKSAYFKFYQDPENELMLQFLAFKGITKNKLESLVSRKITAAAKAKMASVLSGLNSPKSSVTTKPSKEKEWDDD